MYRIIALFITLILPDFVFAEDSFYDSLNHAAYEPSYMSMFLGLVIVICLIYITGFLYKKLSKVKLDNNDNNDKYKIQIVSSLPIGQHKNLYVIKLNSNYSLIGTTQDKIAYLKDLGEDYD